MMQKDYEDAIARALWRVSLALIAVTDEAEKANLVSETARRLTGTSDLLRETRDILRGAQEKR